MDLQRRPSLWGRFLDFERIERTASSTPLQQQLDSIWKDSQLVGYTPSSEQDTLYNRTFIPLNQSNHRHWKNDEMTTRVQTDVEPKSPVSAVIRIY